VLKRLAQRSLGVLVAALLLGACALAPSDPSPPVVALRVDNDVLHVAVGECLGPVRSVSIMRIAPDGVPGSSPIFETEFSAEEFSVALVKESDAARGGYSLGEQLLIEVETADALAVGVWPGASATFEPPGQNRVLVDEEVIDVDAFESLACP
jgi:hypothetical protein